MKKLIIIVSICVIGIIVGQAQSVKTDSLFQLLKNAKGTERVQLLLGLGEEYRKIDNTQSLKYYKEAYSTGKTYEDIIKALEEITYFLPNDITNDSLIFYSKAALELSIEHSDTLRIMQFLVKKGWNYFDKGEYVLARKDFKKAFDIYLVFIENTDNKKKLDPYKYSMLANNLGVVYTKAGVYDTAIHYLVISLEEKIRLKADKRRIVMGLYNLSAICAYKEDYQEGLKFAQQSLDAATEIKDSLYIVRSLNNLGVLNKKLGNVNEGIKYYERAIKISKNIGFQKGLAIGLSNLGIVYTEQKNWQKAKKYLLEALELNEIIKDKSSMANSVNHLANYYMEKQEYDSVIIFAEKSLALSLEIGEIRISEHNYKILSKAYSGLKQYDKAYFHQESYLTIHDSIYNLDSDERYNELQTKYQTTEKEKRIVELNFESELQKAEKQRLYWLGGILTVIGIFIIILIFLKRRKDQIIHQKEQLVFKKEKALADSELEKSKLQEQELKNEIQYKSKQLTTHALNMMQKNTLMQEIQEELIVISKKANETNKPLLNRIKMLIRKNLRSEKDWDLFKLYFEDVNKQFYLELAEINTDLTPHDLKLCALLKLNMNIKESASVMNIEPASVKTARYKLRKKLALKPEDDLVDFIRKIG